MARPRLPRNVIALGLVSLFTDLSSEMIYPLLPVFLTVTLGAGPAILGIIEGIAEATASLLKLFSGAWSDRLGKKKPLVVGGYLLSSVARPLMGLAAGWGHVPPVRFSDRIGKGIRSSPRDALIAASVPADDRGRAFGLQRAMDHLGAVLGPGVALLLLAGAVISSRSVFFLAAVPGAAAVVALLFLVRDPGTPPPPHAGGVLPDGDLPPVFRRYLGIVPRFPRPSCVFSSAPPAPRRGATRSLDNPQHEGPPPARHLAEPQVGERQDPQKPVARSLHDGEPGEPQVRPGFRDVLYLPHLGHVLPPRHALLPRHRAGERIHLRPQVRPAVVDEAVPGDRSRGEGNPVGVARNREGRDLFPFLLRPRLPDQLDRRKVASDRHLREPRQRRGGHHRYAVPLRRVPNGPLDAAVEDRRAPA